MPSSELATTSKQRDSSNSGEAVRKWLVVCGEVYRQELTPALVGVWKKLLHDLDPKTINRGFEDVLKTSKFFPTPAEFFAAIQPPAEAAALIDAENAWQLALEYVREFVCPGLPCYGPPLEPQMQFAVRAAGGLTFLECCSAENLIWAKKRFLEAWGAYRKVESFDMLPECEVKTLLREFAGKKALPLGPVHAEPMPAGEPQQLGGETVRAQSGTASDADKKRKDLVVIPPSEEELQRRAQKQKQRQQEWLSAHAKEGQQPAAPAENI